MQVAIVQPHIIWQDIERNLANYKKHIEKLGPSNDLILLPEMCTTGFSMNCEDLAEPMHGLTHEFFISCTQKYNCTIAGSIIVRDEGNYYNRLLWITPDGTTKYYDKRHLFSMGFEDKNYVPGQQQLYVSTCGFKIMPLICYDLRFPVWSRNKAHYDLLIYVANWPAARQQAWEVLLQARAIENQCFVIGVNRVGEDGNNVNYIGGSMVVNARGEVEHKLSDKEEVLEISLNKDELIGFRNKFPVLNDADDFTIHL
ncbi:MAG: amidohydrolase [Bacteroidetes bacterium]|jgi:predicted amidohydrolase|nr:amidohydrolase [Bacteroidota bacterium]